MDSSSRVADFGGIVLQRGRVLWNYLLTRTGWDIGEIFVLSSHTDKRHACLLRYTDDHNLEAASRSSAFNQSVPALMSSCHTRSLVDFRQQMLSTRTDLRVPSKDRPSWSVPESRSYTPCMRVVHQAQDGSTLCIRDVRDAIPSD